MNDRSAPRVPAKSPEIIDADAMVVRAIIVASYGSRSGQWGTGNAYSLPYQKIRDSKHEIHPLASRKSARIFDLAEINRPTAKH
jgi:hypothetical protein